MAVPSFLSGYGKEREKVRAIKDKTSQGEGNEKSV